MRAAIFVLRRKGRSYAQAEKPEIQEPGRPGGLPRTAAIARLCRRKKCAGKRELGRCCACILRGFSGPVAELAATGLTVVWGVAGVQSWPVVALLGLSLQQISQNFAPCVAVHASCFRYLQARKNKAPAFPHGLFVMHARGLTPLNQSPLFHPDLLNKLICNRVNPMPASHDDVLGNQRNHYRLNFFDPHLSPDGL